MGMRSLSRLGSSRILFITGTDTGVGKTLLTALLLAHLRSQGQHAIALKPFCSGTRADAELLHSLQDGDLSLDEINPFYFSEPIAPLVAARIHRRRIPLAKVLQHIHSVLGRVSSPIKNQSRFGIGISKTRKSKIKTPFLLIEGSGGLLVPLGEGYTVLDLIAALNCEVVVVSRNKLGTINHTLLTIRALQQAGIRKLSVALMDRKTKDVAGGSNYKFLAELLAPLPVHSIPFLRSSCRTAAAVKKNATSLERLLAFVAAT
jgi:dethiobiotin synthetase